ncbi:MAG: membrane dipeptidase, partial [Armatimonadetes bacterium]|nr:membrane dipeptidase [Armatimonadota bacterium]
ERAKAERKLGLMMGFQSAEPLEDDWINTLPVFYRMGIRVIQLTYNERNLLGCGCLEPNDDGLTAYGRQVVGALNGTGVIIDLSHVGQKTAVDAIKASRIPVIVSHANARALTPHPRNLPDDTIKALADAGGVMGAVAWSVICQINPDRPPTLHDFLEHIDYVVNLVGVDHVGIGSDINENFRAMPIPSDFQTQYRFLFKGDPRKVADVEGFAWLHEYPNVVRGLVARGYSDEDIVKIMGGNFLRVAREAWQRN